MIYIYLRDAGVVLSEIPPKKMKLEMLTSFRKIQDARTYCLKNQLMILEDVEKKHTGITEAGRLQMREKKLGENNPNAAGLSMEHRRKISLNKKLMYQGSGNPMFARKHSMQARRNISFGMYRIPKRYWAVSPEGHEHLLPMSLPLPPGYVRGRKRR